MLDIQTLGNRIKALRIQRGLTQSAFAEALCVTFQAVSNWERGIAPPDLDNLINIANYFGILVDNLLRSKNEDLFLGIDGGGTKTEFAVVSSDGCVLKRLVKGRCNPNDIGYSNMFELLKSGIDSILLEIPSIKTAFLGIAGISAGNYAERLQTEFKKSYPQIDFRIKNDAHNIFAIEESADMAAISGTGSVVFVRTEGEYKRLGGWGYLFDDAGSAYGIGRDAIREALSEEDLLERPSMMSDLLRAKMNTPTVWNHINTIYNEGKAYVAGFASVVFDAYLRGDAKANQIIDRNANNLAKLLNAGVELYKANPVAIAGGGIFEHYKDIVLEHIKKYSNVKLIINDVTPIYGACKLACTVAGRKICDDFYENFKKTYRGIK